MTFRLLARYRIARRLQGGRYVFVGFGGAPLVKGRIATRLFSVRLLPARVLKGGIVRRVDVYRANNQLAVEFKPKPFTVASKTVFGGKQVQLV